MDGFIDRSADIAALQRQYDTDEPSLITNWGRRRVGKTELVEHSTRDREDVNTKPLIPFVAITHRPG